MINTTPIEHESPQFPEFQSGGSSTGISSLEVNSALKMVALVAEKGRVDGGGIRGLE